MSVQGRSCSSILKGLWPRKCGTACEKILISSEDEILSNQFHAVLENTESYAAVSYDSIQEWLNPLTISTPEEVLSNEEMMQVIAEDEEEKENGKIGSEENKDENKNDVNNNCNSNISPGILDILNNNLRINSNQAEFLYTPLLRHCNEDVHESGIPCVSCCGRKYLKKLGVVYKTLKNSSIARGDGKIEYLKTLTFVNLHIDCHKNYTNNLSITAFKRRQEKPSTSISPQVTEYLEKVLAYGEAHHFPEDAVATVCRIHDSIMDETTI
ncbi:hypothetical protein PV328_001188 [Microctonus aethiopoides]|uniref:Uncharacterized protein n=1 Tax=Microctonus aethiopoides TaxID=144406 RepID=A0AA39FXM5_9HYME|nr:hypothetical protein PV328_001188 [Microctonus aethiopoides]